MEFDKGFHIMPQIGHQDKEWSPRKRPMIDYHIHTPLCDHAEGSMEACVRQGISLGLLEICFLDHLTIRSEEKPKSMTPEEVPLYLNAVKALKDRYNGKIAVKAGLEVDYNPDAMEAVFKIIDTFDFDVVASSVHFLNDIDVVSHSAAAGQARMDPDTIFARYLETLYRMCRLDFFDVICHVDLIKKFGRRTSGDFQAEIEDILSLIREQGHVVEVNTSGLNHPVGEIYPSPSLLAACREKGIPVTLGSDAHRPEAVGGHRAEGLAAVRNAGYQTLTGFTRRIAYAIDMDANPEKDLLEKRVDTIDSSKRGNPTSHV